MKLNRIYTRHGDGGQTQLIGGVAVPKTDPRIEGFGTIDELNAHMGMLTCRLRALSKTWSDAMVKELLWIQDKLFDLGADLATPAGSDYKRKDLISASDIKRLEQWLDFMNEGLAELQSFVLPGSGESNAWAHLARVVCRRAERQVCALSEIEEVDPNLIRFLNRLSDVLFVLSRCLSKELCESEVLWGRPLR